MVYETTHPFRCTLILEPLYNEISLKAALLRPVSSYSNRHNRPYRFAYSSWHEIKSHWEQTNNAIPTERLAEKTPAGYNVTH